MKKKLFLLFAFVFCAALFCVVSPVRINALTPNVTFEFGDVYPGENVRVRVSVESGGVLGINGTYVYDESKMTFVSIKLLAAKPYELDTHGNSFLVYDTKLSTPINIKTDVLEFEFSLKSGVKAGDVISFGFSSLVLSDGEVDYDLGKYEKSAAVLPTPEDNVYLKELSVAEGKLAPAFSKDIFAYSMTVDRKIDKVTVTATPEDSESKTQIGETTLNETGSTQIDIAVTGKHGGKRTYSITVFREDLVSDVPGTLGGLTVEGFMLSPDFRPDRREYVVYLPFEQSSLDVSTYAAAEGDIISVSGTEGLKVGDNTIRINVVSPDGKTSEYKIKAVRADFYYGENGNNGDKNDTEVPETAPAEENTKSSGGFPGWLAVMLVILALAGGAFGGYFLRAKFPDGVIVAFKKRFGKTKLYK